MSAAPTPILVVDDDEATLSSVGDLLALEGYPVEKARDGSEALRKLAGDPLPGLVLLDLKMPVMDGWEFLSKRAGDPRLAKIPIVLLSGLPFIPNAPGVVDFLAKPIDVTRLFDCVRRFCGEPPASERSRHRPESRT